MPGRKPAAVAVATVLAVAVLGLAPVHGQKKKAVEFTDAKVQAERYLRYYENIKLTSSQEAVKKAALVPLPAPCCTENTAYTCCCPCNMSRTVWGLSAYLITEHGYDADAVREKVKEWLSFIAPQGHSGNVCSTRGCNRPFNQNGCGGMSPTRIIW